MQWGEVIVKKDNKSQEPKPEQAKGARIYTVQFWDQVQELWESHDTISLAEAGKRVAERYNIEPPNKTTVSRKKVKEKWVKDIDKRMGLNATALTGEINKLIRETTKDLKIEKADAPKTKGKSVNNQNDAESGAPTHPRTHAPIMKVMHLLSKMKKLTERE